MLNFRPTKISIIIPVLDSYRVVRRHLKHFKSMGLPDTIEIIIMDDGSDPPLKEIFAGHTVKNLNIYPTGDRRPWTQPCAKNLGAKIAQGEYLLMTDVDHIFSRELIAAVENFDGDKMEFGRQFAVLTNRGEITQDPEVLFEYGLDRQRYKKRGLGVYKHTNTFAMKKQIFMDIDGYHPRYCNKGIHDIYDDNHLYHKYRKHCEAGKCKPAVKGPDVFVFPASGIDPIGLFHKLERKHGIQKG